MNILRCRRRTPHSKGLLVVAAIYASALSPALALAQGIHVESARIGCLDIQHTPNLTALVRERCEGHQACTYKAPTPGQYRAAGVHVATRTFCTQAMEIVFQCGHEGSRTIRVPGDAWKQPAAQLFCENPEGHAGPKHSTVKNNWVKVPVDQIPPPPGSRSPETARQVRVPSSEWVPLFRHALAGLAVRINDYDPSSGQSFVCGSHGLPQDCGAAFKAFLRNDSYLRYRAPVGFTTIGNFTTRFTPGFDWNNPFLFLVNDIEMPAGHATVTARDGHFVLVMPFESRGREIVASCHNDLRCGFGPPDGNNKPGGEINNLVIRAPFRLWVDNRANGPQIRTALGKVTYTADIHRAGACRNNALAVFCDIFAGNIERQIGGQLTTALNVFVMSNQPLIHTLDDIANTGVCRIARMHGQNCAALRILMVDRTGTLWMVF